MAIEEPIEDKEEAVQQTAERYKVRIENVNGWYGSKKSNKRR